MSKLTLWAALALVLIPPVFSDTSSSATDVTCSVAFARVVYLLREAAILRETAGQKLTAEDYERKLETLVPEFDPADRRTMAEVMERVSPQVQVQKHKLKLTWEPRDFVPVLRETLVEDVPVDVMNMLAKRVHTHGVKELSEKDAAAMVDQVFARAKRTASAETKATLTRNAVQANELGRETASDKTTTPSDEVLQARLLEAHERAMKGVPEPEIKTPEKPAAKVKVVEIAPQIHMRKLEPVIAPILRKGFKEWFARQKPAIRDRIAEVMQQVVAHPMEPMEHVRNTDTLHRNGSYMWELDAGDGLYVFIAYKSGRKPVIIGQGRGRGILNLARQIDME